MSYDEKFRRRAIKYAEEGNTYEATAKIFKISPNTLSVRIKQYREKEEVKRKCCKYKIKIEEGELKEYIKSNPEAYQSEIAEHFKCDTSTVCRTFKIHKITRKKTKRYEEQRSEKIKYFLEQISNIPKEKIVYIDETGINTYYALRILLYSKREEKVIGYVCGKRYQRVGIMAAQMGKEISITTII